MIFTILKGLLTGFTTEIDKINADEEAELFRMRSMYQPHLHAEASARIHTEYNAKRDKVRKECLGAIQTAYDNALKGEDGKITAEVDINLLNRLNTIDGANILLKPEEIEDLARQCLRSRSDIAIRKIKAMAEKNNVELTMPDPSKARECIEQAKAGVEEVIHGYTDKSTSGKSSDAVYVAMRSDGVWLDALKDEYGKHTLADLKVIKERSYKDTMAESDERIHAESKPKSYAEEYLKQYQQSIGVRESAFVKDED